MRLIATALASLIAFLTLTSAALAHPLAISIDQSTRITLPGSDVRLSAGRQEMSDEMQSLCFLAGANSIFSSETGSMLTKAVPSPSYDADKVLLDALGMTMRAPFTNHHSTRAAELSGRGPTATEEAEVPFCDRKGAVCAAG